MRGELITNNKKFVALGIGKLGRDFINQLQEEEYNISGVDYVAVDFDEEKLKSCKANDKIVWHKTLGFKEDNPLFAEILTGIDVLFLFASTENAEEMALGLAFAKKARAMNILTLATILSYGGYDFDESTAKIRTFKTAVDALMILSLSEMEENDYRGLFYKGLCDRMCWVVKGLTTLMQTSEIKFNEVKYLLRKIGTITCSSSNGLDENCMRQTALDSIDAIRGYQYEFVTIHCFPDLEYFRDADALSKYNFNEATRILVIIATKKEHPLADYVDAVDEIKKKAECNAVVVWGNILDENLEDNEVRVILISAFGFEAPSGNYYETYEEMFKNESLESLYNMLQKGKIVFHAKDKLFGITFLEAVARYGNAELLELCIQKGAIFDLFGDNNKFVFPLEVDILTDAIEYGNLETLKVILKHGITKREHDKKDALAIAIQERQDEIAIELIKDGFDINSRDENYATPLMFAAERVETDVVKALVEAGADLKAQDDYGQTPLMYVANNFWDRDKYGEEKSQKIVCELLDYMIKGGADVNIIDFKGQNALMKIINNFEYVNEDIIQIFINAGLNINHVAYNGNTALNIAILNRFSVVPFLLKMGVDVKLLTLKVLPFNDEDVDFIRRVIRKRCERFGLVPFENLNEALDNNDDTKFIQAVENGLFNEIGHSEAIYDLGAKDYIYFDGLPLAIKIRYNTLKNGKRDFLTKDYAENNKEILIGMLHLAISDYNVELVKILIEVMKLVDNKMLVKDGEKYKEITCPLVQTFPCPIRYDYAYYCTALREFKRCSNLSKYRGTEWEFYANVYPEDINTELKRKFNNGAEILKLLNEAGAKVPTKSSKGEELTYTKNSQWRVGETPDKVESVFVNDEKTDESKLSEKDFSDFEEYFVFERDRNNIHSMDTIKALETVMASGKVEEIMDGEIFKKDYYNGSIEINMKRSLWDTIECAFIPHELGPYPENNANLLAAAYCGNVNDIKEFLGKGADINAKTAEDYTPLMYAAMFNAPENVKFLIENGANVNAKNFQGQTALSLIILNGGSLKDKNLKVIDELIKGGVNINKKYEDSATILMLAAENCFYHDEGEIAIELIENGADINAVRDDGMTASTIAYKFKNWGTLRVLLAAGADVSELLKYIEEEKNANVPE